ncbi:MAG: hypothetical protein QM733_03455 [Ilumatobacteraceae bacterium]
MTGITVVGATLGGPPVTGITVVGAALGGPPTTGWRRVGAAVEPSSAVPQSMQKCCPSCVSAPQVGQGTLAHSSDR